jgi:uncharacterized protein (TIGR03382 family)
MTIRSLIVLSSLALASFAAGSASGAIAFVTGQTTFLALNPANCTLGMLTGNTAFAWDEQQGVNWTGLVDLNNPPATDVTATPGIVSGMFDSHFLHFDHAVGIPGVSGTVVFQQPIAAVIFRTLTLDNTDATFGALGTTYPTLFPFRDIGVSGSSFSAAGNTLAFNFNISPIISVTQIRVLTHHVPAPSAAAVAGLAGLATLRRRRR